MVVNIGLKIEDVDLDTAVGTIVQRRTIAYAQHTAILTAVDRHPNGIHPIGRNQLVSLVHPEIGSRET